MHTAEQPATDSANAADPVEVLQTDPMPVDPGPMPEPPPEPSTHPRTLRRARRVSLQTDLAAVIRKALRAAGIPATLDAMEDVAVVLVRLGTGVAMDAGFPPARVGELINEGVNKELNRTGGNGAVSTKPVSYEAPLAGAWDEPQAPAEKVDPSPATPDDAAPTPSF